MGHRNEACRAAVPAAIGRRGQSDAAIAARRGSAPPPDTKRWLAAALAVAVAPKCLLCLAGYLTLGGAAVELCGGKADGSARAWLVGGAAGTALLLLGLWRSRKKRATLSGVGRPFR